MAAPSVRTCRTTTDVHQETELAVRGRFDLGQSISFGFGQRHADPTGADVMRLAFCLDGLDRQVGVAVRQPEPTRLQLTVVGDPDLDLDGRCERQVARVLSVDLDGRGYDELGRADPTVGRIQSTRPGLRPPLFYSAYEAALWGILSARQPAAQMFAAREQLARRHGRVFVVAGHEVAAGAAARPVAGRQVSDCPACGEAQACPRLRSLAARRRRSACESTPRPWRALDPEEAGRRLARSGRHRTQFDRGEAASDWVRCPRPARHRVERPATASAASGCGAEPDR